MARVHVDAWRVAYADILPVAELQAAGNRGFSYDLREEMWRKTLSVGGHGAFVAVDQQEILGFASGGENRVADVPCDGELYAIYVHPNSHRKGVGKALLRPVVDGLLKQGFASMSVWFFRDNTSAKEFYTALGAEYFCASEYEVAGVKYPDVAYIWPSLTELRNRLSHQR